MANYLAIDLGAESGRVMLGKLAGGKLTLQEVHRFPNGPVALPDGLHWDALRLFSEIKTGIALGIEAAAPQRIVGLGIDTWGVDYALLDARGALMGNPYHYRDARTDGIMEAACARLGREAIFEATGIQFLQFNTLYQLLADGARVHEAKTLLTMPDLFNYWLTGRMVSEFSIATTTQCYDPRQGDWARDLLVSLGLPAGIFPRVVPPGTVLGEMLPGVAEEVGLRAGEVLRVVAPACHDTGSAVAAVPAGGADFAYVSSGTWSLMGAELTQPVITPRALAGNFTNEGGVGGTFRFLRNITGLWLVQECRRAWRLQGQVYSYDELTAQAAQAAPLRTLVNPDAPEFLKPGDYPARIRAYCQRTRQPVPDTVGEVVRCALESLALKYRKTFEQMESILGRRLEPVYIVGGGSRNRLLNQFAADALGRRVVAGPVEATAIGNVLAQAVALRELNSQAEARAVVRQSFDVLEFTPGDSARWDDAYQRAQALWKDE